MFAFTAMKHRIFCLWAMLLFLTACQTLTDPVNLAETTEQKAYAMYGQFTIFEEQAAALIQDVRVDDHVKLILQDVDAKVKPVADQSVELTLAVEDARRAFDGADTGTAKLIVVTSNLQNWIDRFEPMLAEFITAVTAVTGGD